MKTSELTTRPFVYTAVSGSAASNFPGGSTVHNLFGFAPNSATRRPTLSMHMQPLSRLNQPEKYAKLSELFEREDAVLVLDEVSLLTALLYTHMNDAMKALREDEMLRTSDWGHHDVILAGDWNQIPAIGGKSIPDMLYSFMLGETLVNRGGGPEQILEREAVLSFKTFKKIELTEQQRAQGDPEHIRRIQTFVDYSQRKPITDELIAYFRSIILSEQDVQDRDSVWNTEAVCLTNSNAERCYLNEVRGELFARIKRQVMVRWPLRYVRNDTFHSLTPEELEELRRSNQELNGYFIRGAPCTLTENVKPEKGLSNGTQAIMNSLVFDEDDPLYAETINAINSARPGSVVDVQISPIYVIVEYLPKEGITFTNEELLPREMASPITPRVGRRNYVCIAVKNASSNNPTKLSIRTAGSRRKKVENFRYN